MKLFYPSIFLFLWTSVAAQNFNGQWKGSFNETSYGFTSLDGGGIDYVLEIQIIGSTVGGYSYTYFNEGNKRYYTICKLTGSLNKATKDIVVTEIERVKFNTPPGFQNCFQTHKLHYGQDSGEIESLRGTWIPAPNQDGNCGYGTTFLSRKIVRQVALTKIPVEKKAADKTPKKVMATKPKATVSNTDHKPETKPSIHRPGIAEKADSTSKSVPSIVPEIIKTDTIAGKTNTTFEPRRTDIVRTIPIYQPTFKVDFYDNGVIDGDSITVFYNGKVIVSHKMLTTNAISLTLSLDVSKPENIITMYADNLGTIPPNTALLIVTDGDKRYEVHMSSDTEKSASVIFVHGK